MQRMEQDENVENEANRVEAKILVTIKKSVTVLKESKNSNASQSSNTSSGRSMSIATKRKLDMIYQGTYVV